MKEYKIELSEEKNLISSTKEKASEIDMILQIWQDLKGMDKKGFMEPEDVLIRKVLEQILEKEFNSVEEIPMPSYYDWIEKEEE